MRTITVADEVKNAVLRKVCQGVNGGFKPLYWGIILDDDPKDEFDRIYVSGYDGDGCSGFPSRTFIVVLRDGKPYSMAATTWRKFEE